MLRTPGAQVPGAHRGELSLRLHGSDDSARAAQAHAFAAPPFAFAPGAGGSGPLADGCRLVEVDDPRVEVSAIEPRADGAVDVRLVNLSAEARRARVRFAAAPGHRFRPVDLAGRPLAARTQDGVGGETVIELAPWRIATLRAIRALPG
jgi:hypothetical protein